MEGERVPETGVSRVVVTERAPRAVGAYSQALAVTGEHTFVFASGQLPIDVHSGKLTADEPGTQCAQALRNALAIVEAAGGAVTDVVRATLYITDMNSYEPVNNAYADVMGDHRPARSVIGVNALPRGAGIEIELLAAIPVTRL